MNDYSVVIPAYNASKCIGETIETVLSQSVPAREIILVDDGSTDQTVSIARQHSGPIRILTQDNSGPGAATTRGIQAVKTELVATLDSDDLWSRDKMERQINVLRNAPDKTVVFCHIKSFADPACANILDGHPEIGQIKEGWGRSTMCLPTALALENGHLKDLDSKIGEMVDWVSMLKENGANMVMMPDLLAHRRIHPTSLSFRRDPNRDRSYLEVARRAILRKRAMESAKGELAPKNK